MILLCQSAPEFGAIEHYLYAVADGLARVGREVTLLCPDDEVCDRFQQLAGVSVVRLPRAVRTGSSLRLTAWLLQLFRELHPISVHLNDPWPQAALAARLARVPQLLVTHHTPALPRRDNLAGRLWSRLGWALTPEIVYTSETDRAADRRAGRQTRVVYYGIDLQRFVDARPALERDGPVVGTVARIAEQKGQRYLVEAAPAVLGSHPEARFLIVGDGELRGTLEELARELGVGEKVSFVGWRDDVPELLASMAVFALPSLFEGLCYAVIEAQAAGAPVVATAVGGVSENVVQEETGLIVPARDPEALAAAIIRLLDDSDEAARLAAEARRRVLERYAISRMVEETIALYRAS